MDEVNSLVEYSTTQDSRSAEGVSRHTKRALALQRRELFGYFDGEIAKLKQANAESKARVQQQLERERKAEDVQQKVNRLATEMERDAVAADRVAKQELELMQHELDVRASRVASDGGAAVEIDLKAALATAKELVQRVDEELASLLS
ncbi:MAG: hypothetical protein MHM6MM_000719 [Cercozoa sp. M6MM]